MTIVTSGILRLGANPAAPTRSIASEFGGNPGNFRLDDYYAGGQFVVSGTTGLNGPIPTAGRIAIDDFYNSSSVIARLIARRCSKSDTGIVTLKTSYFAFDAFGVLRHTAGGESTPDTTIPNEWIVNSPVSVASGQLFEFRFTRETGTVNYDPNNAFEKGWIKISTTGTQRIRIGFTSVTTTFEEIKFRTEIREAQTQSVVANVIMTCDASQF